jgi:hypothetical protein
MKQVAVLLVIAGVGVLLGLGFGWVWKNYRSVLSGSRSDETSAIQGPNGTKPLPALSQTQPLSAEELNTIKQKLSMTTPSVYKLFLLTPEETVEWFDKPADLEGQLLDANGQVVGRLQSSYQNYRTVILADYDRIPILPANFFYEGWIVRMEPFEIVSTGPIEYINGKYVSKLASPDDLLDHNIFLMTLEPFNDDETTGFPSLLPADVVYSGVLLPR